MEEISLRSDQVNKEMKLRFDQGQGGNEPWLRSGGRGDEPSSFEGLMLAAYLTAVPGFVVTQI
jgi:hypothetical protein